jgi:hypothetical protein
LRASGSARDAWRAAERGEAKRALRDAQHERERGGE